MDGTWNMLEDTKDMEEFSCKVQREEATRES
jgi:hypothetical protein